MTKDLILARKESVEDNFSIANSSRFVGQRVFDCSQMNMLVKSLKKLQPLIDLLFE